MAEQLEPAPEERVLDVGTGSGYAAAVLSRIFAEVYTIERHEALAASARERFDRLDYENIEVRHGDGSMGWPERAPFDAIEVAAAGPDVPQPLLDQLAVGGRLVVPTGPVSRAQELKRIRRVGEDSYERLCHESEVPSFLLPLRPAHAPELRDALADERLERAIGVIYRPETELRSHYFQARLPQQFDEYVWFDETEAVTPLTSDAGAGMPDTFPFGV